MIREQQTNEKMVTVIASCQSCNFKGEIQLPWETGTHLLVTDCPICHGRKTLTPISVVTEPEVAPADTQAAAEAKTV